MQSHEIRAVALSVEARSVWRRYLHSRIKVFVSIQGVFHSFSGSSMKQNVYHPDKTVRQLKFCRGEVPLQ